MRRDFIVIRIRSMMMSACFSVFWLDYVLACILQCLITIYRSHRCNNTNSNTYVDANFWYSESIIRIDYDSLIQTDADLKKIYNIVKFSDIYVFISLLNYVLAWY